MVSFPISSMQPSHRTGMLVALMDALRTELKTGGIVDSLIVATVGLIVLIMLSVCSAVAPIIALPQQREGPSLWQSADEPSVLPATQ